MKNFREEQVNSVSEPCINQYWEKEVEIDGIKITFHYWKRKEGYKGYTGKEGILEVVGVKNGKKRRIEHTSFGEQHCIEKMIKKFAGV
jgi:hypothetical protein